MTRTTSFREMEGKINKVLRLEVKIFRVDDFEIGTPSEADLSYIDQILRSPSPLVLFASDQA
jgi:hypothetical protein